MDFTYYMKKQIIGWLDYNRNRTDDHYCYVYPRVLCKGNDEYEDINLEPFFDKEFIAVYIAGGKNAEEVCKSFGCKDSGTLVNIRINKNVEESRYTSLQYNSTFGKNGSEIWIEPFSSKLFYQVVDIDGSADQIRNGNEILAPQFSFTNQYFLRNERQLVGPFEAETKEDYWELRGIKENDYIVGAFDSLKYNDDLYIVEGNNGEEIILLPKSRIALSSCEKAYDWISEKRLIELFSTLFSKNAGLSRDQTRKLDTDIRNYLSSAEVPSLSEARLQRIYGMVEKSAVQDTLPQMIIQHILADEDSKQRIVDAIIENNFEDVKEKIISHKQFIDDVEGLKADIKKLEEKKNDLIDEIKSKSASLDNTSPSNDNNAISQQELIRLRQENSELKDQCDSLQKENDSYLQKNRIIEDIESLKKERADCELNCKVAKKVFEQQKADHDEALRKQKEADENLEKTFNQKLSEFENRAQQAAKVIDDKLLKRILKGLGEDSGESSVTKFNSQLLGEPMTADSIIDRIGKYIREKAHRNISDNDVANYLICLSQGFITTFAGEPGTGKTSLCSILAKSLGLSTGDNQNRFVDISVERGWTSVKDFIGYYNPLTKSMEKSNLEVFDAFERMDTECGNADAPYDPKKYAPFIVLLDEANLSPIEHYWASFLKNCDFDSTTNRTISLGGNCRRSLPEHLRFLATVNFDHTTEELSPRFLDRSWVISLEPSNIDIDSADELNNYESMIDFYSLKEAFSVHDGEIESDGIRDKWDEIQRIFRDASLPIMPRNLRMVRNYCLAASKCMDLDRPSTRLAPIDYAFSQKILPTINGSGEKYEKLIDELLAACPEQSMPISNKHLRRMKEVATNNMGFYQFFAR